MVVVGKSTLPKILRQFIEILCELILARQDRFGCRQCKSLQHSSPLVNFLLVHKGEILACNIEC
uniref:Uncharacterized protein n=1 Tax=Rhizophora mucronata TaxID=61149 RepID=A0A2P2MX41_RHIMU